MTKVLQVGSPLEFEMCPAVTRNKSSLPHRASLEEGGIVSAAPLFNHILPKYYTVVRDVTRWP